MPIRARHESEKQLVSSKIGEVLKTVICLLPVILVVKNIGNKKSLFLLISETCYNCKTCLFFNFP